MPVNSTVLFDRPQYEIASLIRNIIRSSSFVQFVTGFATVEGLIALREAISLNPRVIDTIVVGAATYRAYEVFDNLISMGVPIDKLFVHLGHTKATSRGARHKFYRYHPMLHSKIYYMEQSNGSVSVIIGSHNLTGFALLGLNGEAGVLLEGDRDDEPFKIIRQHINNARSQSINYKVGMKAAYAWWTNQFMEGLTQKTNDVPREGLSKKTIVIIAATENGNLPNKGDQVYFELPIALGSISSLRAEVHLYLFETLPSSPWEGLRNLQNCVCSFWCKTLGLEMEQGGVELIADWYIDNNFNPTLKTTPTPFRPDPSIDMQQVRVQLYNEVFDSLDYLFDSPFKKWEPVYSDKESAISVPQSEQKLLTKLDLVPREDVDWCLVKDLKPPEMESDTHYTIALKESSPDAGSYVMMSTHRRKLES